MSYGTWVYDIGTVIETLIDGNLNILLSHNTLWFL